MKKLNLLLLFTTGFLFFLITGCSKQYTPEETQNLISEYTLTIIADMQDWQLNKMSETQFLNNTRNNLKKIESILDNSTVSEAQKRIYKNSFEMYYNLLGFNEYNPEEYNTIIEKLQNQLTSSVMTLANLISVEELDLFHTLNDTKTYNRQYQDIKNRLIEFAFEHDVLYAYYWRNTGFGKLQYIIDNDTDPKTEVGPWVYEDIEEEIAFKALNGQIGITDLFSYSAGDWEGLLSAYAPVYDKDGKIYCIAGVDIEDAILVEYLDKNRR